jgi:hypothetical protein
MVTPIASTPTTDHQDPQRGNCGCTPGSFCPPCMGKLQRYRDHRLIEIWLREWDRGQRPAPSHRPTLRLVLGGRS